MVASRLVGIFTSADGDYTVLAPRASVIGGDNLQFPSAKDHELTIASEALEEMVQFADKHRSYSLIVIHDGVIQKEWYADGWNSSRPAQSQSMHKSLLPILVQAAIEDGFIESVDDPIGRYIEEWGNDTRGETTIENLLVMSSGLRSPPFSINPFSDDFLWLFGTEITPILLRTPRNRPPGEAWDYNNINSEILGLIIERATGISYARFLSEKVWKPMGGMGAEVWLDSSDGKAHSNCCLITTPMDWARFGSMLLNRGAFNGSQIVNGQFIDRMISPALTSSWYGYQIWLNDREGSNPWLQLTKGYQRTEPFARDDAYFASGFGGQRVYVVPSEQLVIVRMGPATGRSPVQPDWDNAFLVNKALRNIRN